MAWKWRNRPVKNFERMCIRVLYAFQFRRADRDGGRGPGSTSSDWLQRTSFETTLGANLHASYTSFAIDNSLHFSRTNRYFVDREEFKINMDFVSM